MSRKFTLLLAVVMLFAALGGARTMAQDSQGPHEVDWKVSAQKTHEESKTPQYTVDMRWPVVEGGKADAFNKAVKDLMDRTLAAFKKDAAEAAGAPNPSGTGSFLYINYDFYGETTGLISVRVNYSEYMAGAAHPNNFSSTLNFDLNSGKMFKLAELFKAKSNYLAVISKYATTNLKAQNRLDFPEGAQAKAENYANWAFDRGGIMFTFDPYQVGPYAAGRSEVLVPYSILMDILNPDGPPLY
jgi:hypothetical protein